MDDLYTTFENNDKVAHAVWEFIQHQGLASFTLRPFNRFNTAFTEWWLIPATEWPAYKYGKLCFHRYPRTPEGVLYSGYYVEKGLGSQLNGLPNVQKKHLMQGDWQWHEFVNRSLDGEINKVIKELSDMNLARIRVLVEIHAFNKVPKVDMERSAPSDTIEFEITAPGLQWQLIQPGKSNLAKFNGAGSLRDLLERIYKERDLDYFWIDLVIGARFRYGNNSGWDASDIWMKVLQPWTDFVH